MQHRISVGFYSVKVYPKFHPELSPMLDKLPSKKSIINLFKEYLKTLPTYDETSPKIAKQVKTGEYVEWADKEVQLAPKSIDESLGNYISAVLHGGQGGYASDIVDRDTGSNFKRTLSHVELIPFYVCLDAPTGTNVALLGLQRFGIYGVASSVTKGFEEFLKKAFPEFTAKISPIYVGELFLKKYYKEGKMKSIELTKYKKVADKASKGFVSYEQAITLTPQKRGDYFPKSLNGIFGKKSADSGNSAQEVLNYYSLGIDASDFDNIKVEVECGGVKRKIDIGDTSTFATHYDVTEYVSKEQTTGHPVIQTLQSYVFDLIRGDIRKIVK